MKTLAAPILAFAFAHAYAAPPSSDSVERLLLANRTEAQFDAMYVGYEQVFRQALMQMGEGKFTSEQVAAIPQLAKILVRGLKEAVPYDRLKVELIPLYQQTYDQDEVDAALAFLSSPQGRSFVEKSSALVPKAMAVGESMMRKALPTFKDSIERAVTDLKAGRLPQ